MLSDPVLVLATLLDIGLAAEATENLPRQWRAPYEAMRSVRGTRYDRLSALEASLKDDPRRLEKLDKIKQAAASLPSADLGQVRVYSAWETQTDPPTLDWLANGLLARSSLNLIVGAPGSKKTWLALDLAVCIASGSPWLGFETQPAPALIIDEEGGLPRLWDRLHRVMRGHNAPAQIPLYFISMAGYNLATRSEVDHLIARAQHLNAGLIIIDALANVMAGTDENNVLTVQPVFSNLRRLAQVCNAAVLVVHHTNKQGIFRGSTLIASGVDHMLAVESGPQDPLIHLRTLKARDLEPISITARAHFEDSKFWLSEPEEQTSVAAPHLAASARNVISFIFEHPGTSTHEIISSLNESSPSAIRKIIYELMVAGYINRRDSGSRGKKANYQCSEKGKTYLSRNSND